MFPFFDRWETHPLAVMRDLQNRVNRLFEGYPGAGQRPLPAVNLWTSETGAVVTAELPGVDPADLDISVTGGNTLTIRGVRKPLELGENDIYHRQERGYGEFVRTLDLPFDVEANKVEARAERGVLRIELPRAEKSKPRRITVTCQEGGQ